jgi:hypothetical protein
MYLHCGGKIVKKELLVFQENGEACAMKEVDLDSHPEAEEVIINCQVF